MVRKEDIKKKILFAYEKQLNLLKELNKAIQEEKDVEYLSLKTHEIVSHCRECLDYCAKDMADHYFSNSDINIRPINQYKKTGKIYFPFLESDLTDNKKLFSHLKIVNPELYEYLLGLVRKFKDNGNIDGTFSGQYRLFLDLKNFNNRNKHDSVSIYKKSDLPVKLVAFSSPSGSLSGIVTGLKIISKNEPEDFGKEVIPPNLIHTSNVEVKDIYEFRVDVNNWEIGKFTRESIMSTATVLSEIYSTFFQIPGNYFNPIENSKSEETKRREFIFNNLKPIYHNLAGFILFYDDKKVAYVGRDYTNWENESSNENIPARIITNLVLLSYKRIIFDKFYKDVMDSFYDTYWSFSEVELNNENGKYSEITINYKTPATVTFNNEGNLIFNKLMFGIQSEFRHIGNSKKSTLSETVSKNAISFMFGRSPKANVIFDNEGNIKDIEILS